MPQEGYRCTDCIDTTNRCEACRERKAEVRRKLRARRRAEKKCIMCGKKAKAGFTRCADCIADNAARSQASHAAARATSS